MIVVLSPGVAFSPERRVPSGRFNPVNAGVEDLPDRLRLMHTSLLPALPPAGGDSVEWVLLTSVPVVTVADARERVAWYRDRWLVEGDHTCLKTGCRLETSQLREKDVLRRRLGRRATRAQARR